MIYWPTKAPDEVLDLGADWSPTLSRLEDAVIADSIWTVESGNVVLGVDSIDGALTGTMVRVSGGTADTDSIVLNTVTLADGQVLSEKCYIKIRE